MKFNLKSKLIELRVSLRLTGLREGDGPMPADACACSTTIIVAVTHPGTNTLNCFLISNCDTTTICPLGQVTGTPEKEGAGWLC